ncbi:50S ribosomal protein L21 [Candidatus Hodgkinia cicadicola]|nr:50S ribosomal protein L21 [Candidatus Hodgkinia cicadicola]
MIISVNNNQYKPSRSGLVKLKNTTANTANIIIGKVICFRCGDEVFYNNKASKWVALIKPIGQESEKKLLGIKFKRRKNYRKSVNVRRQNVLAQVVVLIKGSERTPSDNSGA